MAGCHRFQKSLGQRITKGATKRLLLQQWGARNRQDDVPVGVAPAMCLAP